MSRIAVPGQAGLDINAQRERNQFLTNVRIQIATEIYANLLQVQFAGAMQQASQDVKDDEDPFGVKGLGAGDEDEDQGEGGPREVRFQIDVGGPAQLAVGAAERLMVELKLLPQPKAQGGAGGDSIPDRGPN